ncbi:hypothetical protein RX830_01520 [Pseudomonas syringae pv. actinidiae]|nr:hypothetical protein [Pseudomonas syringae pv. actinidiae]MDU8280559.1 hypothetical protein [Pseudomonas syringae pv. actinidiae]MDU8301954.1 hypothetical protein [Pseudomonas syringae pv. actinidiae]
MQVLQLLRRLLSSPFKTTSTATATKDSIAFVGDNNGEITITNNNNNSFHQNIHVTTIQQPVVSSFDGGDLHTEFDRQIDLYREQLNEGAIKVALDGLKKLLAEQEANLTDLLRFRVEANIAFCHYYLGNLAQAPNMLLRACTYAPQDKRAIANKTLALILKGDVDTALEFGVQKMGEDPDNEYLAGYVLQAVRIKYEGSETVPDYFHGFSERVRLNPNVRIAQIHLLAARNESSWKSLAEEFLNEFPEESQIKNIIAHEILRHCLEHNQTANGFTLRESDLADLQKACSYLEPDWVSFKRTDRYAHSADLQNIQCLLVLYKLTGKTRELVREVEFLLGRDDIDQPLILVILQSLVDLPEPELFERAARKLQDESTSRKLSFQFKIARKDWKNLSEFQDYNLEKFEEPFCSQAKVVVYIARAHLLQARGKDQLVQLLNTVELDPRGRLLLFEFAVASGVKVVAELARTYGGSRVGSGSEVIEFHHYMKLLLYLAGWSDIVSRLVKYPGLEDSYELKHMLGLGFLNEGQISSEADDFFKKQVLPKPKGFELLCGVYYAKLNDFERSIPMIEQYLNNGGADLFAFIVLCDMAKLSGSPASLVDIFQRFPPDRFSGSAEQWMYVARLKAGIGKEDEALREAYSLLTANPKSSEIALGFFNLCLMTGAKHTPPSPSAVTGGVFYSLRSSDGEVVQKLVDDNAEDVMALDPAKIDMFTSNVLGQSKGFSFVHEKPHKTVTWTLEEIKHPYVHAFHEIGQNFENRFPNAGGLWLLTFKEGDMQPLLDFMTKQQERDDAFFEHISNNCVPFEIAAGISGRNIFQTYDLVRNKGRRIQSCLGTNDERLAAEEIIQASKGRPVVIDTYALKVASDLRLLQPMADYFGRVLISHDSLQTIQQLALEESTLSSLSSPRQVFPGSYSTLLSDIKSFCEIITYTFPRSADEVTQQLLAINVSCVVPYAIAREHSAVLLTEDLYSRALAGNFYNLRDSLWLRSIVDALFYRGCIDFTHYCDAVLVLAKLKHGFVSIDNDFLEYVYQHDNSLGLVDFAVLMPWIGGPNSEPLSHVELIRQFLIRRWYLDYNPAGDIALDVMLGRSHGDAFPSAKARRATTMLLNRLMTVPMYQVFLPEFSEFPFLRWHGFFNAWLESYE